MSTSACASGNSIPDEHKSGDSIGFQLSSIQGRLEDYQCVRDPDSPAFKTDDQRVGIEIFEPGFQSTVHLRYLISRGDHLFCNNVISCLCQNRKANWRDQSPYHRLTSPPHFFLRFCIMAGILPLILGSASKSVTWPTGSHSCTCQLDGVDPCPQTPIQELLSAA